MDEIQEIEKHKIDLEGTMNAFRQSLINEAMVSGTGHSHVVKAASLIEKEKTLEDLIVV